MNIYLMLMLSVCANLFGGIIRKYINNKYENSMFSYQFYNCIVSLLSAVTLVFLSSELKASLFTIVLAVIFGLITLIQQITNLYALENGPFSYTTVLISLSTLIPTLSGAIFWKEKLSYIHFIGIVLLIICFVLSVNKDKSNNKASVKWLVYSLIAFVSTGLIGVMQKVHQTSEFKSELDSFLVIAFICSFLFSGVYSIFLCKNNKNRDVANQKKINSSIPVILMVISGIFVALNNKFNLYLSGVMDSAVFFPVVNGGGLVLSSVAAVVIFREKLSIKQWIGISVGIVSVVLLCNPFNL